MISQPDEKGHFGPYGGIFVAETLMHALERRDLKRGVAAICLGGGEAVAVGVERN